MYHSSCFFLFFLFSLQSICTLFLLPIPLRNVHSVLFSSLFSDCSILTVYYMYHLSFNQCRDSRSIESVTGLGSRLFAESGLRPRFLCAIVSKTCWIYFKDIHPGLTSKSMKSLIYFFLPSYSRSESTEKSEPGSNPDPDPPNLLQHHVYFSAVAVAILQKFNRKALNLSCILSSSLS